MRRYLSSLLLGAALCAPVVIHAQDEYHDKRYYDKEKKDYHEWNEREDHAYRHWLQEERHREYHPWEKASREEQKEYWRWRHEHMDWH
jgi:type III secretory pathway component EscR